MVGSGDHEGGGVAVAVDPFGDCEHDVVVFENVVQVACRVAGVASVVLGGGLGTCVLL